MPAMSLTLNCSVNWLNTRISPADAGLSIAIWMHRTCAAAQQAQARLSPVLLDNYGRPPVAAAVADVECVTA
jgi:hypothetical protein